MKKAISITLILLAATLVTFGQDKDKETEVKVDPKIYDTYVGEYAINDKVAIFISKDGDKLMGEAAGKPKIQLVPQSETRFLIKEAKAEVEFVKNDKGKVTHLVYREGDKEMEAKRVE